MDRRNLITVVQCLDEGDEEIVNTVPQLLHVGVLIG